MGRGSASIRGVFPGDEAAPHTASCQCGGDGHTWQRPPRISGEQGLWLGPEALPGAAAAAAEGAEALWVEEPGDRSVCAAFPRAAAAALGKFPARTQPRCSSASVVDEPGRSSRRGETTPLAFLETEMRNELPKASGKEETERQFGASS